MKSDRIDLGLTGYDELFMSTEERLDAKKPKVDELPLDKLKPFKNHPFKVMEDEEMERLKESIRVSGVLIPALARPAEDGYELISGHRRLAACRALGMGTMPVIIRTLTDEEAIITMVDSNLQREHILPSEKAFAYKMKMEALKSQGKRTDLTSYQVGAVDKVSLRSAPPTKKDALWRHPACFIIRFRFNAVADKRQWSSAASKPRRKTRAKLCSRFCAENEPSHQTCRSFSASRYSGLERRSRLRCRSAAK